MWDSGLFWDSRVESLGKDTGANGAASGIRTPDSVFATADSNAGDNLVAAQARFPVTSVDEMKTTDFEDGSSNASIRSHLAARIGNYGEGSGELASSTWVSEFQAAFASSEAAEELISFDNIALAISEYERSMVFIDSPWKDYIEGNNNALSNQQKQGAILFLTSVDDGGAGCASCHSGDQFSDGLHHVIAFPQIGPGKGDGDGNNDDFGRARETGNRNDRYHFRTASLLNISATAPYGHSGAYETLRQVVRHYDNPRGRVADFFDQGGWCQLQQFADISDCASLYPFAETNSNQALQQLNRERDNNTALFQNTQINNNETDQIVAFLQALTDPCVEDRDCLAPWIADPALPGPDGMQLNAIGEDGDLL
nr:cytochrome c peroxidase [Oceanicoccus sagamiensis]